MTNTIQSIANNTEKYLTYKEQMTRLNKARTDGFYFESIFILYAIMEDRWSAFLFHAGVTNNTRESITRNKKVCPHLVHIFETENLRMRNIGSKLELMKTLVSWSEGYEAASTSKDYPDLLCRQLNRCAHKDEIIDTVDGINTWRVSRNELVHTLLNKKIENQEDLLIELVETGLQHSRDLDSFVRSFKVRNTIRIQFNIQ